jgi:all-trans-retinol dehydrogenase (NAD+)
VAKEVEMNFFENKNIILTGAGSGIGRLMALLLAEEKANLALVDVDSKNLNKTMRDCVLKGSRAGAYRCDISKKSAIDAMLKSVMKKFGHIDILINNAGIVKGKFVHEYEFDDIRKTMEVNFVGGAYLTARVLPGMMKRNRGQIVNVASAMGLIGVPRMGEYVASKHAIVGFTDTLRMELRRNGYRGIGTLCVCPSGIDTGMFPGYKSPLLSPLLDPEKVARKMLKSIKRNRTYLMIPASVRLIPAIKLFPARAQDAIAGMIGLLNSMDHYRKGR